MLNQSVTCLPPPLPPKTKIRHTIEEIKEDPAELNTKEEQIVINSVPLYHSNLDQEKKSTNPSTSLLSLASSSSSSAIITTVNLSTVDLNIPDRFLQENQQQLTQYSSWTKNVTANNNKSNNSNCNNTSGDNNNNINTNNNNSKFHGVKILINPNQKHLVTDNNKIDSSYKRKHVLPDVINCNSDLIPDENSTQNSVNNNNSEAFKNPYNNNNKDNNNYNNAMVDAIERSTPSNYFFNQYMPNDQMNSDILDSGACNNLNNTISQLQNKTNKGISVTLIDANCVNLVDEKSYEERHQQQIGEATATKLIDEIDSTMFYNFHLNEKQSNNDAIPYSKSVVEDETFAGYKDLINGDSISTIRSSKGTVRGVKNRVRAGIATFLQINSAGRSYKEKDAGKVVVYTTSMGIIRDTYQACTQVKQILRTLLVKFEERDVFMNTEYQKEIRDRMRCDHILVPQLYIDGQHCGDAKTVEILNETGELRKILKPFKNPDVCSTCPTCGGYRLLPCGVCNGSKKSVHRNHFTAEFVALKCMNCDENGLVKCNTCS